MIPTTVEANPADRDDLFAPHEALCLVHNLTFNRALGACPIETASAPTRWSK